MFDLLHTTLGKEDRASQRGKKRWKRKKQKQAGSIEQTRGQLYRRRWGDNRHQRGSLLYRNATSAQEKNAPFNTRGRRRNTECKAESRCKDCSLYSNSGLLFCCISKMDICDNLGDIMFASWALLRTDSTGAQPHSSTFWSLLRTLWLQQMSQDCTVHIPGFYGFTPTQWKKVKTCQLSLILFRIPCPSPIRIITQHYTQSELLCTIKWTWAKSGKEYPQRLRIFPLCRFNIHTYERCVCVSEAVHVGMSPVRKKWCQ